MKYFLCGNSGIINRGCEAIIDSTVKVLNCDNGNVYLATFAPNQDYSLVSRTGINMISYNPYPSSLYRYFCVGMRRIFKKSLIGLHSIQKPLFDRMTNEDISLNIGGDTYCYNRPINSLMLNKYTNKHKIKNILWCCSIEKNSINKEIFKDLNRYSYVFAREQLTVENLLSIGIPKEKIVKVCDPAFFLDTQQTELPNNFIENNTVGLNLSEMVINGQNPHIYENIIKTINYILENTSMNVCLIPHVYNVEKETNDFGILKKLYQDINSNRVSLIDSELNCRQLKYIISKCRFFIGARTHSTIAAYSSQIPTLVLGYSIKSKGIATDLFGTYKDFVIPYTEITEQNEILSAFKKMVENEDKIKAIYRSVLPEYKKQLTDAISKYLTFTEKPYTVCDKEICSGCSACASVCPHNAITMLANDEGFLYPQINKEKCIQCGLCKKVCPTLNKTLDDLKEPRAFAGTHKTREILLSSSSGGVFTALAEEIIDKGGVVFGAAYDNNLNIVHIKVSEKSELQKLRGSKYVQSEIGNTYIEAKELLEKGKVVLFTGTPCQIGGLISFLGKNYINLYTQDVFCRAIASPKVWQNFLDYYKKFSHSDITNVFFRDKTFGWNKSSMRIEYSNNKYDLLSQKTNIFMNGFINNLYTRSSCYLCSFRNTHRSADITLGDFWGIEKLKPTLAKDNKGVTLILTHSSNGENLLNAVKNNITLEEVPFKEAVKCNPTYLFSPPYSTQKSYFFKYFNKIPFKKLIKKCSSNNSVAKMRRFILKLK